jgi:ABC-2 type transport system ATP-binding protein
VHIQEDHENRVNVEAIDDLLGPGVGLGDPPSDPVIDVRGLNKSYGYVHAMRDVDLQVHAAQCMAVVGPNGAGKTTLIEVLEGHRRADAGTVRVLGVNPAKAPNSWRERIGIVSQRSEPIPGMSVGEVVTHWAGFYRAGRDPSEVLATVGLEHKSAVSVASLSGGLRRRLEFGLAIIGRPELLFLDEPTIGLDPAGRETFWELIRALKSAGTTVFLTTHNLEEAARLADQLVVVAVGRVYAMGNPLDISQRLLSGSVVRWRENGSAHEVATENPAAIVRELADRLGGRVDGLEVVRPGLEEAYLKVVQHLTDEDAADPDQAGDPASSTGSGAREGGQE